LHLSAATALTRDWLGSLPSQTPAFFNDAEDDIGVVRRRLAAISKHFNVTFKEMSKAGLHLMPMAGKDIASCATTQ
jgi:hypothetical protein